MSEIEEIEERYARRRVKELTGLQNIYSEFMLAEREAAFEELLLLKFKERKDMSVLEIGAGEGSNIPFFLKFGIAGEKIFANELLESRVEVLKNSFPGIRLFPGDAMAIPEDITFNIVFQSTVFSSILDDNFRRALADKMFRLTRPGGIILWYDFVYNNPVNKDVRKVTVKEIRKLFNMADGFNFRKVTLAPPIGRRVGKWYPVLNIFPILRTHFAASIYVND